MACAHEGSGACGEVDGGSHCSHPLARNACSTFAFVFPVQDSVIEGTLYSFD